jgi:hypothetical protein
MGNNCFHNRPLKIIFNLICHEARSGVRRLEFLFEVLLDAPGDGRIVIE